MRDFRQAKENGLKAAIAAAGDVEELAQMLHVSPDAIRQWNQVPAERLAQTAHVTKIPYSILRPDIFAALIKKGSWSPHDSWEPPLIN